MNETPLAIGHRGGRGLWPENTLLGFARAMEIGIDGAELDVQLTRDGQLAVSHDFRIGPAIWRRDGEWWGGPRSRICDLTLEEIRSFDVGRTDPRSPYGAMFPEQMPRDGEHVPLLAEVLDLVGPREFRLLREIKTAWHDRTLSAAPEAVTETTLAVLREKGFVNRATLVSFDWVALLYAHKIVPDIPCWHLTLPPGNDGWQREADWAAGFEPSRAGSVPKAIAEAGGQGWLAFHVSATEDAIEEAHALGLKVGVWNVNDVERIRDFAARGVDAICSDYPDRLIAAR